MVSFNEGVSLESIDVEGGPQTRDQTQITTRRTLLHKRFEANHRQRRRNDMLLSLGLLELANATDFAANVWNGTPPPTISIVFMALGGTSALIILAFACRDVPRTWRNSGLLRLERRALRSRLDSCFEADTLAAGELTKHNLMIHMDINTREMGNELVDRLAMGLTLGFGALTVGIGTYLAIAGANDAAFLASNILTGYLGNVPAALYGIGNAAWCTYGWRRAQSHARSVHDKLPDSLWGARVDIAGLVQQREDKVKTHALVNGVSGILGGIGSLMTASAYIHPLAVWGYLILIPCVVSAMLANVMWRKRINYDRDMRRLADLDADDLLLETGYAALRERLVAEYCRTADVYHSPPLFGRRKGKRSEDSQGRLHAFVLSCFGLQADLLTYREALLTKKITVIEGKEPNTEGPVVQHLHLQRQKIRQRFTELNTTIAQYNQQKTPPPQSLFLSLLAVFADLDIIEDLYAHLANSRNTSSLVNVNSQTPDHLETDPQILRERISEDASACGAFVRIAEATLLNEGVEAARSRKRYLLEVVGCFFLETKQSCG